jgi:hypothetical protein
MNILKFDAARVVSSEYAAFSSVRPIKLKSMTPFPGYSNRHGVNEGGTIVVVVVEVVPIANIIQTNLFSNIHSLEQPFQQAHLCVKRKI